jgi:hypothetical protein
VSAGDPPCPAHEVVELSNHDPRTLIAKAARPSTASLDSARPAA